MPRKWNELCERVLLLNERRQFRFSAKSTEVFSRPSERKTFLWLKLIPIRVEKSKFLFVFLSRKKKRENFRKKNAGLLTDSISRNNSKFGAVFEKNVSLKKWKTRKVRRKNKTVDEFLTCSLRRIYSDSVVRDDRAGRCLHFELKKRKSTNEFVKVFFVKLLQPRISKPQWTACFPERSN